MTVRSYFLLEDIHQTRALVSELKGLDFSDDDIHVIASNDIPLDKVPEADLLHRSDLAQAAKRGVVTGGTLGVLGGTGLLMVASPAGLAIGGGALLTMAAASGAVFGAWTASLVGVSVPNTDLDEFRRAIEEEGRILVLVDAEDEEQAEVVAGLMQDNAPTPVTRAGTVQMLA